MASVAQNAGKQALKQGAKRDPELYILLGVMSSAFGLAGYYFGRNPTSASSEDSKVLVAEGSRPWDDNAQNSTARDQYKYQYHPGGDPKNPPRDAPSALHSVIVPNVNLPKELHEKWNKYGKDGF